ncbi:restriction endonuclease subunit S [Lactobacillus melliventris]|uniref:restriction endonuclease subunit S n=1 Tax=Lactobacillus melliventris TaxID=1218507 RepID=UPI0021CA9683|nr:restriction endonuclease subunit S [Lactobacillus melliventris]
MKYKISEIAEINKKTVNKNYKGKVFYLDTSSVTDDFFDCPKIYTSLKDAPSRARRLAENGDTIISTVRPAMKHIGYISHNLNRVYSTGFAIISPKKSKVDPFYLYLVLSSKKITDLLQSIAVGSTSAYPSIKPYDIGNLTFDFPSLSIQEKIASIIKKIILKIKINNRINDNLMLQKYFSNKFSLILNNKIFSFSLIQIRSKNDKFSASNLFISLTSGILIFNFLKYGTVICC